VAGHRLFAAGYDPLCAAAERAWLGSIRAALLAQTRGVVLEVGGGTGANLAHYPAHIERLIVTEPDPHMRRQLVRRADSVARPRAGPAVEVLDAVAERLPVDDHGLDSVVSTLVLCTVDDPGAALAEARRALRPGGRLVFLEHVRADDPAAARWQDRLEPLWRRIAGGCHPNRDTLTAIQRAGFDLDRLDRFQPPLPFAALHPFVFGVAIA
jgi:ubiquinone/menaquinone biosynthesis C-methylase UbiE